MLVWPDSFQSIQAALCGTKTLRIRLTRPVPVLIFYGTASVSRSMGVRFSEDIYGHDATLDALLRRMPR